MAQMKKLAEARDLLHEIDLASTPDTMFFDLHYAELLTQELLNIFHNLNSYAKETN